MTETEACVRGCTMPRFHFDECAYDECRGCLPRRAQHGHLCTGCHLRLRNLVRSIHVQHALLLATAAPTMEQALTAETTARTHTPPRTDDSQRHPNGLFAKTVPAASESEPIRLAKIDAARDLSDWLSQVLEALVEDHDLTGPPRLRTGEADPRAWKWRPADERGVLVSDFDPMVTYRDSREVMRGQYILTDPPARFEVRSGADFLLAWLDRFEESDAVGDDMEALGTIMSQCHALAPWREQATRLPGIPCPGCSRCSLMRFGGDEDVQCTTPGCREVIAPARYAIWVRMLAEERSAG